MKARRLAPRALRVEELETRLTPSTTTSTNWSGYAVTAPTGSVTQVSGSWVVPAVTAQASSPKATQYSSAWVGIDGYNSNSVEQIGTDSDLVGGVPTYYAWYEMYPNPSYNIAKVSVSAGDTISASVSYSSGKFTLSITDTPAKGGTAQTFSITQSNSQAQRSSAEWIEEAPSSYQGVLPLADFGTVTFSSAQATVSTGGSTLTWGISALGSKTTVEQINMVTSRGVTEATTSALTSNGAGFSVTWDSSGASSRGGRGGSGWWFSNNQANDPTVAAAMNQAAQQATATAAAARTTQPILASSSALGAPVNLPTANTFTTPVAVSLTSATPTNLYSLYGPTRTSLYSSFTTGFTSSGGEDQAAPAMPAADAPVVPKTPAPMVDPDPDVPPAADPALELSDACFMDNAAALAAPEDAGGTSDATEQKLLSVEGSVDTLFALALGGLVGIAVEKTQDRRRVLKLR